MFHPRDSLSEEILLNELGFPPPNAAAPFRVSAVWSFCNTRQFHSFQIGHIDGEPGRKGAFPVSFVHFIAD